MSSSAIERAIAIIAERDEAKARAVVDMAISLRVCDVIDRKWVEATDEELVLVGGKWSRREKDWIGDPETVRVVRIPRGSDQEAPARWFAGWLTRYIEGAHGDHWGDYRKWVLQMFGGRRAGKTMLGVVAPIMACIAVRGTIAWAISPTQDETEELQTEASNLLPASWFRATPSGSGKSVAYRFPNGSRLLFISGHKPRALKRGRCDIALYNEAQNMPKSGMVQVRGAIADRGGLLILACNPPDAEGGRWVEEYYEQARGGKIAAVAFLLTAARNPFVVYEALEAMRQEMDELSYRREILGEIVPIGNIVMHGWSDAETVRELDPAWRDVTADVCREAGMRPAAYVVGMDFQQTPHMTAVVYRFYKAPGEDEIIDYVHDVIIVEDADEDDLMDALEEKGYVGAPGGDSSCVSVIDASAWWQDGAHTKGKTSDRRLAARGWTLNYKPQRESDRNPEIIERVKITNTRLKNANGRRRMFVHPGAVGFIRAMRSWENRNGAPYRRSPFAHVCDAGSYVIYRVHGKPKMPRSKGASYHRISTFQRDRML